MSAAESIFHGKSGYSKGCRCDQCRAANAEYMRAYYARNPGLNARNIKASRGKDKDAYLSRRREYEKSETRIESRRRYARKWYQEHKDAHREYAAEWKKRNRDKVSQYQQKWREKNKDHVREYQHRYYMEKTKHKRKALKDKNDLTHPAPHGHH